MLLAVLLIILSSPSPQPSMNAAGAIGFVRDIGGDWLINGHKALRGSALPPGATVMVSPTALGLDKKPATITIELLNGLKLSGTCSTNIPKCGPIHIPMVLTEQSSILQRIIEAASKLFVKQPERFQSSIVRGDEEPTSNMGFNDAVLELRGGQLDLGPCVTQVVRKNGARVELFNYQSDQDGLFPVALGALPDFTKLPLTARASSLRPGLYRIMPSPLGPTFALVLVADPTNYQKLSASFAEAENYTRTWRKDVSTMDRQLFLDKTLRVLANMTQ